MKRLSALLEGGKIGTDGISEWVWAGWITTFLCHLKFWLSTLSVTMEGYSDTNGDDVATEKRRRHTAQGV
jgi:hypothetical protein